MPKEPKVDHTYKVTTSMHRLHDWGQVTATNVTASARPNGRLIGSHISVIHPRTFGPDSREVEEHNATKADPQMELFLHHGPIIDNYAAHSESGHTAPTILGIAANLSKAQFNEVPSAPPSLSKHSLRVAQQIGDDVPNRAELPTAPTNEMDKGSLTDWGVQEMLSTLSSYATRHASQEEIDAGNATMKQVVQRRIDKRKQAKEAAATPAPTPKAPKPDQLRIPGL